MFLRFPLETALIGTNTWGKCLTWPNCHYNSQKPIKL